MKDVKRVYANDVMQQRWEKAMEFLRSESKTGLLLDKPVEKIKLPVSVFFQGKLQKIISKQ